MLDRLERFEQQTEEPEAFDEDMHRAFQPLETPSEQSECASEDVETTTGGRAQWIDTGMHDVPLESIDVSDSSVHSESGFQKVSHEEMVRGFQDLEREVRPAVEQGADGEHFRSLDEQHGLDYQHGCHKVYEAFYGSDAIRLNKVGDSYEVVNGYHRLYVAEELGLDTVPARVIEQRY